MKVTSTESMVVNRHNPPVERRFQRHPQTQGDPPFSAGASTGTCFTDPTREPSPVVEVRLSLDPADSKRVAQLVGNGNDTVFLRDGGAVGAGPGGAGISAGWLLLTPQPVRGGARWRASASPDLDVHRQLARDGCSMHVRHKAVRAPIGADRRDDQPVSMSGFPRRGWAEARPIPKVADHGR